MPGDTVLFNPILLLDVQFLVLKAQLLCRLTVPKPLCVGQVQITKNKLINAKASDIDLS